MTPKFNESLKHGPTFREPSQKESRVDLTPADYGGRVCDKKPDAWHTPWHLAQIDKRRNTSDMKTTPDL